MENKYFKYALMGILFLVSIFSMQNVHAEKYTGQAIWPSEKIQGIYIRKERPDGYKNGNKLLLLDEVKIINLFIVYNHILI